MPQFSRLQNGDDNGTCTAGLWVELNDLEQSRCYPLVEKQKGKAHTHPCLSVYTGTPKIHVASAVLPSIPMSCNLPLASSFIQFLLLKMNIGEDMGPRWSPFLPEKGKLIQLVWDNHAGKIQKSR